VTPDLQPDVPIMEVLLYGFLNPATIAVAFMMGRKADERSKVVIAGFVGAIAGSVLLYFATLFRVWDTPTLGRAAAGAFVVSFIAGMIYAAAGYAMKR